MECLSSLSEATTGSLLSSFPIIHYTHRHVQTCMHLLLWILYLFALSSFSTYFLLSSADKTHKTHGFIKNRIFYNIHFPSLYFYYLRYMLEILSGYIQKFFQATRRDSTPTTERHHNILEYGCAIICIILLLLCVLLLPGFWHCQYPCKHVLACSLVILFPRKRFHWRPMGGFMHF